MPDERQQLDGERAARLTWIATIGAVTAEALALHEASSVNAARGRLLAASRAGLLARSRPLAGRPALFTLSRAGLRACGLRGEQPLRVSGANAEHMIVCASVAIALERCYPDHRVLGERELRCLERDRGAPLASAVLGTGPQGVPALHRPDLVLWPQEQGARPIAVEVELTVKAPRRLAQICRSWARCRGVRGVLYLAAPAARRAVERAVAHVHAADRVFVLALEDLPGAGFIGVEAGQPEKRECR